MTNLYSDSVALITKAQLKALHVAQGHLNAGNLESFYSSVGHLARAASSQKQQDAILDLGQALVTGYRFDFRGRLHWIDSRGRRVLTSEAAQ